MAGTVRFIIINLVLGVIPISLYLSCGFLYYYVSRVAMVPPLIVATIFSTLVSNPARDKFISTLDKILPQRWAVVSTNPSNPPNVNTGCARFCYLSFFYFLPMFFAIGALILNFYVSITVAIPFYCMILVSLLPWYDISSTTAWLDRQMPSGWVPVVSENDVSTVPSAPTEV